MAFDFGSKSNTDKTLDSMPANILTCDPTTSLINYANISSTKALNGLAGKLSQDTNGDNIIGRSLDTIYPDFSKKREEILSNLPHNITIIMGSETLDIHIDAAQNDNTIKKLFVTWSINTEIMHLKAMFDTLPLNILTCDPKTFVINSANRPSVETLNRFAHLLPDGVNGETIIGKSIDVLYKPPAHEKNVMRNTSTLPHSTIIRLGPELLDLHIDSVMIGGKVKNLVLSWSICTERERLKIMVDNMPINIMMAETENFTINYMNQTSLETLRLIEHLLPVTADEVYGISIDRFHKKPEHQRAILSDPKNLPYNSKIKLGEEMLQLNVAAIEDKDGYYIGPMVSWNIITAQENLAKNVMNIANIVLGTSTELQDTAESLSQAAKDSSQQSTTASAASEEASTNVQTVASATEELSASIQEISRKITESDQIARQAMEQASATNETVSTLRDAAKHINSVVVMINDIAEQTNLLALNATIEAARAGDAGKGFAVVASEVKALARQTADATDQIQKQITTMQDITTAAVGAVDGISKAIQKMCESSTAIAAAMEEQTAATSEIARNVSEAATGTSEVSRSVGHVQKSAEATGQAAQQLLSLSKTLSENSENMLSQVSDFMVTG